MFNNKYFSIIIASSIILGNVLGVSTLGLPILAGLCGYIYAIIGIISVWFIMLMSGFTIIYCIDLNKKNFDMPSFYTNELGNIFGFISIICNMIILYGVLILLSSLWITTITAYFYNYYIEKILIIFFFLICISIILFGLKYFKKFMILLMPFVLLLFFIMIFTSTKNINYMNLTNFNFRYIPLCLAATISAFHFHNIIPTVLKILNYNKKSTYIVTLIGVSVGLIINLIWVTIVVGTIPIDGNNMSIKYAFANGLPSNAIMIKILNLDFFEAISFIFSTLIIVTSFLTTGTGLYNYMKDIFSIKYNNIKNTLLIGIIVFTPPLFIVYIWPNLFLKSLEIVGGVGETILFGIFPAIIIFKIIKYSKLISIKKYIIFSIISCFMFLLSIFICFYILLRNFQLLI